MACWNLCKEIDGKKDRQFLSSVPFVLAEASPVGLL